VTFGHRIEIADGIGQFMGGDTAVGWYVTKRTSLLSQVITGADSGIVRVVSIALLRIAKVAQRLKVGGVVGTASVTRQDVIDL